MYCCLDERLYPKLLRGATYGSCRNRWVKYWSSSRKCILYCTLLKLDYSVGFEQNVHCSTIEIATLPVTVSNFWMCWQFFPLMLFFFSILLWEWDQPKHCKHKCIFSRIMFFFYISFLNSCLCLYLCPCQCPCLHVCLCLYLSMSETLMLHVHAWV